VTASASTSASAFVVDGGGLVHAAGGDGCEAPKSFKSGSSVRDFAHDRKQNGTSQADNSVGLLLSTLFADKGEETHLRMEGLIRILFFQNGKSVASGVVAQFG
jgi:hypothetical protein